MSAERIEPDSWASFLRGFSAQHQGWLVTVSNDGVVIDDMPLESVQIDAEGDATIVVHDGSHGVRGVTDVFVDRAAGGAIAALRLVTKDGEASIRFRTVIAPELVDGMI
jgi:hypothetical protein